MLARRDTAVCQNDKLSNLCVRFWPDEGRWMMARRKRAVGQKRDGRCWSEGRGCQMLVRRKNGIGLVRGKGGGGVLDAGQKGEWYWSEGRW